MVIVVPCVAQCDSFSMTLFFHNSANQRVTCEPNTCDISAVVG